MEFILSIDNFILDFFSCINNPILNPVMKVITHLGDGGFLWILIGIVMLFFKKTRKCGILVLLSLLLCAILVLGIMKPFFGRVRPYIVRNITPLIPPPSGSSFPSVHTSSSFAGAFAIFSCYRKKGVIAFVMASLIALSRMYFLVHYPTDVFVGLIMGILSSFIVQLLIKKFNIFKEDKI